jgi:hypothetical protein
VRPFSKTSLIALFVSTSVSFTSSAQDQLLLAVIEFDGLPTGVRLLDPATGAIMGDFVLPDYPNNGMLNPVEAIAAGPNRTVLLGQPGGDGAVSRYDEFGSFIDIFIGGTPDPNPVDNIRGMAVSADGQFLYTSDWDDTDDVHRFNLADGSAAGNDALGTFITGSQSAPGLDQPQAIEILGNGDLLVADISQGRLQRYNSDTGALIGDFSSESVGGTVGDIDEQADGTVVTAEDGSADRVRTFAADGMLLAVFGFNGPDGVHRLPNGEFLVTSSSTFGQGRGLFRVAANGAILQTIDDTRSYGAIELITLINTECLADVNHDGMVTPTDFTAWINAFNNSLPECDQNGDGNCTPTDFTAWIANFNAGCN